MPHWARNSQSIAKPNIDKWWKPDEDKPINGVMVWHEAILDQRSGAPRRIFVVRDSERQGFHWGVGERSGLVKLRNVPVGSRVFVRCIGRRKTGNVIDGEDQTILDFDVRAETVLPQAIPVSVPVAGRGAPPSTPASDEDVPF